MAMRLVKSRWSVRGVAALAFMCGARAAVGAEGPQAAAEGTVVVRTVQTERIVGTLESFSLKDGLVLVRAGGDRTRMPAVDVVQIDTKLPRQQPHPESAHWVLASGDSIYGQPVGGSERTVSIRRDDLGTLDLPILRLRELTTPAGREARKAGKFGPIASRPASEDDELWLVNGDRLTGLIERIDPNGVALETDAGRTVVALDVLLAARLAQADRPATQPGKARSVRARLTLADGSTLTVGELAWRQDGLIIAVQREAKRVQCRIQMDRVLRVEVVGGRWQWLGRMLPLVAEHTPLLGVRWPHRIDRNVLGGPIRVGGRGFERGIGVHSRSRLVYGLDAGCERLVCAYGLDDDAGPMADVAVEISVDGKRVHHAPGVRPDGQVHRVSVDLSGAKQVELLVDFGKNGHVQDRFNWIEPAVIRR